MTARTTGVKQGSEKNVYHVKTLRTYSKQSWKHRSTK